MEPSPLYRTASLLGLSASFWLSGIYFSSSQLPIPILYRFPAAISADIFDEFYHRGLPVVASVSVISATSFGTLAYLNKNKRTLYIIAACLAAAPMPWTVLFMAKGINTLIAIGKDVNVREKFGQEGTIALLKQWRWQNFVRSAFTFISGGMGLLMATGQL